jgi:hypothetical protein
MKPSLPTESGQAGAEVLFFAFVILLSLTLVIVNAWAVIDAKFMVTGSAREGAHAYIESADQDTARSAAVRSADAAITRAGGRLDRRVATQVDGFFERCGRVTVTVRYRIPSVRVPALGFSLGTREVSSSHTEIVDPYRSGLAGEVGGDCATL